MMNFTTSPNGLPQAQSQGDSNTDMIPHIIIFINGFESGHTTIKDLQQKFNKFPLGKLWSYVQSFPKNFAVEEHNRTKDCQQLSGDELVFVKTDLRLCKTHCARNGDCSGECRELHLCRPFLLLGDMCCKFHKRGKICSFGHEMNTRHNGNLLAEHNLNSVPVHHLRILFRRRGCRSESTMPQVCSFYNNRPRGNGCSNKECKYMHLCSRFAQGSCFGACSRNHSLSDEQVSYVLDLFAIDKSWSDDAVLEELSGKGIRVRFGNRSYTSSVSSIDSDSDNAADDDTELKGFLNQPRPNNNIHDGGTYNCCNHCTSMRSEMKEMAERMQKLEVELHQIQVSDARADIGSTAKKSQGKVDESPQTFGNHGKHGQDQRSPKQNKTLRGILFPSVKKMQPDLAEKITGKLLEMDDKDLMQMITSEEVLKTNVDEAVTTLHRCENYNRL